MPPPTPNQLGDWLINFAALSIFIASLVGTAVGVKKLLTNPLAERVTRAEFNELRLAVGACVTKLELAELKTLVDRCSTKVEVDGLKRTMELAAQNVDATRQVLSTNQQMLALKLERLIGSLGAADRVRRREDTTDDSAG